MSTTKDLLNDMYYILRLKCGSFQNEPDMLRKSIRVAWAMKRGMEANSLYQHYVEIGMLSHLLYSSLGLQLGYKVIYIFQKLVQNIFINLTNYSCAIFIENCNQTSAHAAKADFYGWTGLHGYITSKLRHKFKPKHCTAQ